MVINDLDRLKMMSSIPVNYNLLLCYFLTHQMSLPRCLLSPRSRNHFEGHPSILLKTSKKTENNFEIGSMSIAILNGFSMLDWFEPKISFIFSPAYLSSRRTNPTALKLLFCVLAMWYESGIKMLAGPCPCPRWSSEISFGSLGS